MLIDTIKERLSDELRGIKKNQAEIARSIQVDQSMISNYITGRNVPKLDTFAELCILYDLDANYILGITDYSGKKNT